MEKDCKDVEKRLKTKKKDTEMLQANLSQKDDQMQEVCVYARTRACACASTSRMDKDIQEL